MRRFKKNPDKKIIIIYLLLLIINGSLFIVPHEYSVVDPD